MMNRREFIALSAAVGGAGMTEDLIAGHTSLTYVDVPGTPRITLRRFRRDGCPVVLYIHGATFPSALSVGYRFSDGLSWESSLHNAGFDVWALDFEGFGLSERPREFDLAADCGSVPLQSGDAVDQMARAVALIRKIGRCDKVSIIAHSWGGVCAARFATTQSGDISKLVLFAPPLMRPPLKADHSDASGKSASAPSWKLVTVADQLARFIKDTPHHHSSVLAEPILEKWGPRWLASDPKSSMRTPAAVQVPGGPGVDVEKLWSGHDVYDPAKIATSTLLVRGQWDSVCTGEDAALFQSRMTANVTDVVIPKSGHLAHLETNRSLLWSVTNQFLREGAGV